MTEHIWLIVMLLVAADLIHILISAMDKDWWKCKCGLDLTKKTNYIGTNKYNPEGKPIDRKCVLCNHVVIYPAELF